MAEKVEYIISLKDLFFKTIKDDQRAVNEFELNFDRVAKLVAGGFAVNGLVNFAKEITNVGAQFDSYESGLATLLKSKTQAHEVFEQIKQDAKATPFDTESLIVAERALISTGKSASRARTDTLNLANAIVAVGGSADDLSRMAINMQQISNTGKASALDIKQFAFAGINIYQLLADVTGKNVDQVKEMNVSYDLLSAALAKAAGEGGAYANALQNESEGMKGMISNLGEAVVFLKDDLYEYLKPAIKSVVSSLADMVNWLASSIKWMQEHSAEVKGLTTFIGVLAAGVALYNGYLAIMAIRIGGATVATIAQSVATFGLAETWSMLNLTMALSPIGMWITGIAAVAAGIMWAWNSFEGFRGAVYGAWNVLKEFVGLIKDSVVGTLEGLGNIISGIFTLDTDKINEGMKKVAHGMADAATMGMYSAYQNKDNLGLAFEVGQEQAKREMDERRTEGTGSEAYYSSGLEGSLGEAPKMSASSVDSTGSASKVSSVKPTQINITIDGLVKGGVTIMSNTVTEGASKIRQIIAEELMKAVNDSQRVAGI